MKKIIINNFVIGLTLFFGFSFLAFQGYLFLSTAKMFSVDAGSVVFFAFTFVFNFTTAGFLLLHIRNKNSLVSMVERLFLPKEIFLKPFYSMALFSNVITMFELNQAIKGITSYEMGNVFWFFVFIISFGISNVATIVFKLLIIVSNKNYKIKSPLDSVFIEADH